MRPTTIDDIFQVIDGIKSDVRRLQDYLRPVSFDVSSVSAVNLGRFDGDNVSGLRVSFAGQINIASTQHFMRLQPNGLTSGISEQVLNQRVGWNATTSSTDATGSANPATGAGLTVAITDWVSGAGTHNGIWFDGVLFTKIIGGGYRRWVGSYVNQDYTTDDRREEFGRITTTWRDSTTVVESLSLAVDGGATFTGRVSVQAVR